MFEDGASADQYIMSKPATTGVTVVNSPVELELVAPTLDIDASTTVTVESALIRLETSTVSLNDPPAVNTTADLRFYEKTVNDGVDATYISLEAGDVNGSNSDEIMLILPEAPPLSGQVLKSGAKNADDKYPLIWATDNSTALGAVNDNIMGTGSNAADVELTFDGEGGDQILTWSHADQILDFSEPIIMGKGLNPGKPIHFYDDKLKVYAYNNGKLWMESDGSTEDAIKIASEPNGGVTLSAGDASLGITYRDGGTNLLRIYNENGNDVVFKELETGKDFVFKDESGNEMLRLVNDTKATIAGDLTISGGNITNAIIFDDDITLAGDDGALTFSNAGENSIKIPDNQGSALVIEVVNDALMTVVTTTDQEGIVIGDNGVQAKPAIRFPDDAGIWNDGSNIHLVGASGEGIMINGSQIRPTKVSAVADQGMRLGSSGAPFTEGWFRNLYLEALTTNFEVILKSPDDIAASYTLTFPADAGSDGQVLTTAGASGVLTWTTPVEAAQTVITSVTNAALVLGRDADNDIDFSVDNNITFRAAGADQIKLVDGVIAPVTDNDIALGTTALRFSDLFLAEGGVINWDDGDATLTQENNVVTLASATLSATLTNALSITANGGIGMTSYNGSAAVTDLALDIDGMTDIGADIESGDLIIVDDGAGGTNRKSTIDRVATLFAGTGMTATSAVMNVNGGDGITANSDDIAITPLQTTISSVYNTALKIGRASGDTYIDMGTADDNIDFYAGATKIIDLTTTGIEVTGTFVSTGTVTGAGVLLVSDQHYKKNITPVTGALEKLSKLNPVNYDWREDEFKEKGFDDKKQWGFIAQEIEKVMPELVHEDKNGYQSLNYNGVIPLLTKAMQEQQTEMEKQQKEIDQLKAQLQSIMKMLDNDMSDKTDDKKADDNKKPVKLSMATVK